MTGAMGGGPFCGRLGGDGCLVESRCLVSLYCFCLVTSSLAVSAALLRQLLLERNDGVLGQREDVVSCE